MMKGLAGTMGFMFLQCLELFRRQDGLSQIRRPVKKIVRGGVTFLRVKITHRCRHEIEAMARAKPVSG
jgi:hypothetical protein